MKQDDLHVVFHVEPADRSVGIMAEGFSVWDEKGASWCDLVSFGPEGWCFEWFDNETGVLTQPPHNAKIVEALLRAYVDAWYEDCGE